MKILLFGRDGQLGTHLNESLADVAGVEQLSGYGIDDLDLSYLERLRQVINDEKPNLIINAAAYTAVDRAESEVELAAKVNAEAPSVMAKAATALNAGIIHYSTDYVFDGTATESYSEDDQPNPESVYGSTKLDGENAVLTHCRNSLILRTSWVYSMHGQNFLRTMLRLAAERDELKVVGDQIGAPTTTRALTDATLKLVQYFMLNDGFSETISGVYHMTCGGETSWCGFARAIVAASEFSDTRVLDIPTADYPTPAKRPAYTVLSNKKLFDTFGIRLPDWEAALSECMQEE
ncbi:dTDP-4-dehydrorhamnose reductase [bacterium BMS3Bbin11]|nr:dTDP-4-dehydrorhamnose reductase [bacterium BMS3Abin11]GBE46536.1 dTDP-4-dehydrorhamnose reductase [bacterium BMS3Bbin11]GMT40668.1 MAG: NAD(P)-dependent oxidoreductase [bacterium]HDH08517.1 dTDP-4-dehydrorhamnose reductase [Gammaproteobacteria bacterium]HDH15046.1 dTDP-4-dehydrorhamnose reductase [Gammaproteobacteria bacterium]